MSDGANIWDKGRWALVKNVTFDFMTRYIMEQLGACLDFSGLTTLELGSGTGRLSYLVLKHKARHVTLVDSSKKALALSAQLFQSVPAGSYEIVQADCLAYEPAAAFDVVFSSGVIEHFQEVQRFDIIRRHVELARRYCLIVHPTSTLYALAFNNFFISKMLYGFQKAFTQAEMDNCLRGLPGIKRCTHRRFHSFYTVPILHGRERLNRVLDRSYWGRQHGGLTITCVEKNAVGT